MAWPNPWRRTDENTRSCWGYTFQWTDQHLSDEERHRLKYTYDTLADECLVRLDKISPPPSASLPRNTERNAPESKEGASSNSAPKRDLYLLLQQHASEDEKLKQLWDEVHTVPRWVDWRQIQRGQEVFYRYGSAALTGLAYQSLLGGMGANRIVETLARTGGFSVRVARHRLFETTQFILQCTSSLESIQPGGAGHTSAVRVRFLHAAVRRRILKLTEQRPEYYNKERFGIPINDLDSMATIATFSATLIWLSFPRQGIWMRDREIEDYVALWRLVAYYLGTPTHYFETASKAKAVMESLFYSEIEPTETSKVLANNIIKSLERQPPSFASRDFLYASARWLNGNELADRLGLGRPSPWYWALVAGQCIFFMSICYFYRAIPYLDRKKVAALRRVFYAVIVQHKYGLGEESVFEFKYIPDFHTTTERGESWEVGIKQPGIERRSLTTLIIAVAVLCGLGWFSVHMILGIFRHLTSLIY